MSAPTSHDPVAVNTQDGSCWRRRAVTQSGHGLYALAAVQGEVPEMVLSTLAELAEHGLASMAFALPMPSAPKSLALSEQQIEALVAAGDRVVNDAVHQDLCMCDAWPEKCVSTGSYYMGAWDVSGLETAIPAVLGLWESMRGGELERLRELVQQMVDGLNGHDCPPPDESPMQAVTRFAVRLMEAERQVAELGAAPAFVYRAEHPDSGIVLGTYSNREAAVAHCEALARREGSTGLVSWVPDDSDALSPEELSFFDVEYCDGDDVPVQTCTGYVVTPLELASEYDEEADE